MATYLFTWNPDRWQWTDIQTNIDEINNVGYSKESWSTGVTRRIQPDDRAFLIKLGRSGPRGIVGSGWVASEVYEGPHWDIERRGDCALYVDVNFDTIIDPDKEHVFPRQRLDSGAYRKMRWEPRASGVRIPDDVAEQLEIDWAKFLNRPVSFQPANYPDEVDDS